MTNVRDSLVAALFVIPVGFTLDDVKQCMLNEIGLMESDYETIVKQVDSQQVGSPPQYLQHVVKRNVA